MVWGKRYRELMPREKSGLLLVKEHFGEDRRKLPGAPAQPCELVRALTCHGTGPKWSSPSVVGFALSCPLIEWDT